jgi:hypothetical protein
MEILEEVRRVYSPFWKYDYGEKEAYRFLYPLPAIYMFNRFLEAFSRRLPTAYNLFQSMNIPKVSNEEVIPAKRYSKNSFEYDRKATEEWLRGLKHLNDVPLGAVLEAFVERTLSNSQYLGFKHFSDYVKFELWWRLRHDYNIPGPRIEIRRTGDGIFYRIEGKTPLHLSHTPFEVEGVASFYDNLFETFDRIDNEIFDALKEKGIYIGEEQKRLHRHMWLWFTNARKKEGPEWLDIVESWVMLMLYRGRDGTIDLFGKPVRFEKKVGMMGEAITYPYATFPDPFIRFGAFFTSRFLVIMDNGKGEDIILRDESVESRKELAPFNPDRDPLWFWVGNNKRGRELNIVSFIATPEEVKPPKPPAELLDFYWDRLYDKYEGRWIERRLGDREHKHYWMTWLWDEYFEGRSYLEGWKLIRGYWHAVSVYEKPEIIPKAKKEKVWALREKRDFSSFLTFEFKR